MPWEPDPGESESLLANAMFLVTISGGVNDDPSAQPIYSGFKKVSGGDVQHAIIDWKAGEDMYSRKIPGRKSVSNLTLEKGFSKDRRLWDWFKEVHAGDQSGARKDFRRDVTVEMLNDDGSVARTMVYHAAWPVKFTTPDLDAMGSDVIIETLELAVEWMTGSAEQGDV